MNRTPKTFPALLTSVLCLFSLVSPTHRTNAEEDDRPAPKPVVCVDSSGLALRGFDTVAYFEQHSPCRGRREFSVEWRGAIWRFATEEHKEMFIAAPNRFAPQYGGFCAYTMADGVFVDGNPLYWQIVNGRLFVNCGAGVHRAWQSQKLERIRAADKAWQEIMQRSGAGSPPP
jgi:YHS domain-containing protein